jgi:hypothetical protein
MLSSKGIQADSFFINTVPPFFKGGAKPGNDLKIQCLNF